MVQGLIGGALGIALGLAGAYAVTAVSPTLQAQLGGGSGGGGVGGPGGGGMGGPGRQAAAKTLDVALTAPVSLTTLALAVGLAVAGGLVAGAFGGWRASRCGRPTRSAASGNTRPAPAPGPARSGRAPPPYAIQEQTHVRTQRRHPRYTRGKETVHALDGIDLTIPDGDRLVIQGPTGGGKSTLLQMLGGLDRPSSGEVVLDGTDLAKLPEARSPGSAARASASSSSRST
ncbi:hypothetical protein GCM10023238_35310 [Streptomyces heliomycini]